MVGNTSEFGPHGSNVFRSLRDINVEELLHRQTETLLVHHHGNVVETVEVW